MNYLKQIWSEMREQPLAIWLSITGTAISIFLVMAVFIISNINSVETAPESNRSRMMIGKGMHLSQEAGEMGSDFSLSDKWADNLYSGLKGVENVSFFNGWLSSSKAGLAGKLPHKYSVREADANYWDILDFSFLSGKPYTKAESEGNMNVAVLKEDVARDIFGTTDVAGKEFKLNGKDYRVSGVVRNTSPLMSVSKGDIYIPKPPSPPRNYWTSDYCGNTQVLLLLEPGADPESIKKEVESRYGRANASLKKEGVEMHYHGSPYTMEEAAAKVGPDAKPDTEGSRRWRYLVYAILILLPAINISGMTRSRVRRRVQEIGVRRAYGATRLRVVFQLLGENLLVTLLGGIVGFILCVIFVSLFSNLFVDMSSPWTSYTAEFYATPSFSMLFTWSGFLWALVICMILNILSAGLPVWKAASVNPAEAISGDNSNFVK